MAIVSRFVVKRLARKKKQSGKAKLIAYWTPTFFDTHCLFPIFSCLWLLSRCHYKVRSFFPWAVARIRGRECWGVGFNYNENAIKSALIGWWTLMEPNSIPGSFDFGFFKETTLVLILLVTIILQCWYSNVTRAVQGHLVKRQYIDRSI